jgi:hypothetical protein
MKACPTYRVWFRDDAACAAAIRSGGAFDVEASSYGANDVVLEFLVTSGLWGLLVSMEPDGLQKDNGKPWWALDAAEVLRELAGVDRIAHCGKVLRDVRLMMLAGFNAQAVSRAKARDRPVVDPETLANHLARISPRSAARTFLDHVALMRRKRWLRGGVYVADAHEIIIPYGRRSERIGRVGEKYGYKLVILLNAAEGRERVVGYVLAPLQCGERAMLRIILRALDRRFGPLGKWLRILLLDRGYWGASFLLGLKKHYGIDVVTRAQHGDLAFAQELDAFAAAPDAPWTSGRQTHSRLGDIEVRLAGFDALDLYDEHDRLVGHLNGVVADEYDLGGQRLRGEDGELRPRFHYASTLPAARRPGRIRGYYGRRWVIENQGFRELTQDWALDTLAGRRFNALNARIAFALMLYNADRLLRAKHPDLWEEAHRRRLAFGGRDRLAGPSVAAYTPHGQLGVFTPAQYGQLAADRERNRIVHALREGLACGETLERVLGRLETEPPRDA